MKVWNLKIIITLCLGFHSSFTSSNAIVFNADSTLYEGSNCTIKEKQGVCTIIQDCPRTYLNLSRGKQPTKICNFNGTIPIVCCIEDNTDGLPLFILNKYNTTSFENNTFIDESLTNPNLTENEIRSSTVGNNISRAIGIRSSNKCLNYQEAACPNVRLNEARTLSVGKFKMNKNDSLNATESRADVWISVIGGKLSLPKEFKGAAAVGCTTESGIIKWHCGGTLISENFVLTAAHCLFTVECGPATWVRVGDLNLKKNDDDAKPKNYKILKRIKHPQYKKPNLYHDIALLQLEVSVEFNDYVRPACLASLTKNDPGKAQAIGWGKVDWADEEGSSDLLKVEISLIPHKNCTQYYTDDPVLTDGVVEKWQICAGDEGKDTCQGDSGGGLITLGNDCLQDVIGVTSFGKFCGSIVPAIYTRVSYYVDWIENIVWPDVTV